MRASLKVRYPGARKAPAMLPIRPSECTFCMKEYYMYYLKNVNDFSDNYQHCSSTSICAFKRVVLTIETLDDEKKPDSHLYT